jgi:PPK2 family polyphosphate:nucleotide phosphotransferase
MKKLSTRPTLPPKSRSKKECKDELKSLRKKLFELQNVFYADGRFALLVIFQGIDTAGKDGSTRHVMSCMNPMGVQVHSFKKPTEDELKHDFMWRVYPHIPPTGMIQVFNRSYYEDYLVPKVTKSLDKKRLEHRLTLFNDLESHLQENNIHVLKFFLHISKAEQKARIGERLTQPHKRWKYSREDVKAETLWDEYLVGFDTILDRCNDVPWHVIPSDKRWFRNYEVARILTAYLENLKLKYPTAPGA